MREQYITRIISLKDSDEKRGCIVCYEINKDITEKVPYGCPASATGTECDAGIYEYMKFIRIKLLKERI